MRVYWVPSPKFTAGHPAPLRALVHHRMVGTLASTDTTFTTGSRIASTTFGAGYGCGRSGHPEGAHIHQYVRLGDQAWGNGNWDPTGQWNDRYPVANLNSQTVSIEHHDNGGAPLGKGRGVVIEPVLAVSIDLDRLLLRGDLGELTAAGIRFRSGTETAICRELRALAPGPHTIIDHHYIAGRLKPFCWRPWADDRVGFPQARYLAALTGVPLPDTSTEEAAVRSFLTTETPRIAVLREGAWLYDEYHETGDHFRPSDGNIQLTPNRPLPYVATYGEARLVAYEPSAEDTGGTSRVYFVPTGDVLRLDPRPGEADAAAILAARRAEYDRVKAAAKATVTLPARP